jgi:tRNA threonylcarbamoyladenosine biosynthesis protein TsaB
VLILALDTATERGSLALATADRLLEELSLEAAGAYLTRLLPGVAALLRDAGRRPADLGAIAVSTGPGNFTGLRIGLATAKTLAWSLGCPLVPVPTMEVLAAQLPGRPHPIGVVLDAKRSEVFWGRFLCPQDLPQLLEPPARLAVADLPARLQPPLLLTGPGLMVHGDFLKDRLPPGVSLAPPELRWPRAATVARLARQRLEAGQTAAPEQLTPTYLRPAL